MQAARIGYDARDAVADRASGPTAIRHPVLASVSATLIRFTSETSMLGVLRSTVLMSAAVLGACAGSGLRDDGRAALERPDRQRIEQPSFSEGGVTTDPGASVPLRLPDGDSNRGDQQVSAPQWGAGSAGPRGSEPGVLYAMAYFPAPSGVETERANSLAELYADARAGYGLYSFLLGGPTDARSPGRVAAYGELLRVIDTYVMDNGSGERGTGRHGFLVQVDLLRSGAELYERVRPGLSAQIEAVLARQLRLYGHGALADRLEQSQGPFLVTSLRPAVVPVNARQPMLIVDLQDVGPEYMYSVVDAYDRPIPADILGEPESLSVIKRRLLAIFPNRQVDRGAAAAPAGDWIWLIGTSATAQAQGPPGKDKRQGAIQDRLGANDHHGAPPRITKGSRALFHGNQPRHASRADLTTTSGTSGTSRLPQEET